MSDQWYSKRWVMPTVHILFWMLFVGSPFLFRPILEDGSWKPKHGDYHGFVYLHFANNFMRFILFYVNAYVLIPGLIYKKHYGFYFAVLIGFFLLLMLWDWFFYSVFVSDTGHRIWNFVVFNIPSFSFILISSSAFRLIGDRIAETQLKKEKETENLKTELSFLRSQVSPHFMFNVLNNMVALARKKSDDLEPSLIKLSQLLRYMLYETDEDKVLLENEMSYLKSYIDLQRQRFGKSVRIETTFPESAEHYSIEPMLLIPFVENAFKHGTGMITNAQINIDLSIVTNKLKFSVRNKSGFIADEPKDKTSGIGLNNVKRRLNLLYANNYKLEITNDDGWFTVHLELNMH
ncbi:MAG: histidine kinase [Flavitalea sp.]